MDAATPSSLTSVFKKPLSEKPFCKKTKRKATGRARNRGSSI